ncbi:MAG: thioredoxin family protein [Betaproteobacteria bacterium]|nr:thioredoxin family protein [Betaproteobacteria bacterium]
MKRFPDGLIAVVKRHCPTCVAVEPALAQLAARGAPFTVYSQDDPAFPASVRGVADDRSLEVSYRLGVQIVPTLVRMKDGKEEGRAIGWNRAEWEALAALRGLAPGLPENRPGCGSRTEEPGMRHRLAARFGGVPLQSRRIGIPDEADAIELCYDRGWSDGLPLVPPTVERVLAMLEATTRAPHEVLGIMPPDRVECSVEKVAVNAVMAGCRPEYFPVVLAAVEAALVPEFGLHGVLCTTNAIAPVVMVNGPVAKRIGMNAKGNVFGQGNRANATIGRALQLVVRNVGGGRPGEMDRACFGTPGKYSFCFAEDEDDGVWESYAVEKGFARGASTVTLFTGDGVAPIIDQVARTPQELVRSYAPCLRAIYHEGQVADVAAFLVVGPEHARVFYQAGWTKRRIKEELAPLLQVPVRSLKPGFGVDDDVARLKAERPDASVPKFKTGSLNIIRAGGSAGLFSAIISGLGSITINPVTKEIRP